MTLKNTLKNPDSLKPILIIGWNPDTILNDKHIKAFDQADVIFTGERLGQLVIQQYSSVSEHIENAPLRQSKIRKISKKWKSPIQQSLAELQKDHTLGAKIVIIASGDPMHFGIGRTIKNNFPDIQLNISPAPSCFSLAAAALCWPLQNTVCISAHQQHESNILHQLEEKKIYFCLTKNQDSPKAIGQLLDNHGWQNSKITVLENLGSQEQKIQTFSTAALAETTQKFHPLNLLAIKTNDHKISHKPHTPKEIFPLDKDFIHDGQLTKFAYRAVTLAALNPGKKRILWDIGAGSGSISLGWIKLGGEAYAVEKNSKRIANIRHNAEKNSVYNLVIKHQKAEEILENIADNFGYADAIFMGTALHLCPQAMNQLRPGGSLVANAVTLKGIENILKIHNLYGGHIRKIAIAEEDKIVTLSALKPLRDILQFCWTKS